MNHQATHTLDTGYYQIDGLELRGDHRALRSLLLRFECADDRYERRDLLQLAVDLFEVHTAIEAQARPQSFELRRECEAIRDLLEEVESADPESQVLFANGLELSRAYDAYLANEEAASASDVPATLQMTRDPGNRALLRERARLLDYAERLLPLH